MNRHYTNTYTNYNNRNSNNFNSNFNNNPNSNNPNNKNPNNNDNSNNPHCKCGTPSIQRVTRKQGPNLNRPFFTCSKPRGEQCGFFEWADKPASAAAGPNAPGPNAPGPFNNQQRQQQSRPQQQNQPIKSATGFVWPTTVRGPNQNQNQYQNQNQNTSNTHNPHASPNFNPNLNQNQNSSSGFFGNNSNSGPISEPAAKKPRPDSSSGSRLLVTLVDTTAVSIPIRVTAPQGIKDAVAKFSGTSVDSTKKTVFGETKARIQVTKISEFETFVRAHAPGTEFDYDTPRPILEQLANFIRTEQAREASGDVVTRSLDEVLPSKLGSSLMEFQWHGVHFAMKRGGRCLIGDDMGLGKTIQAIAIARVYMEDWPLLIVCPSSLRLNWKEEILRWLKDDVMEHDIQVYMTGKDASKQLKRVNITSYDLVRKIPSKNLEQCQFIIADESHYLKSPTAQRTKVVTPIVKRARRALLLSGTPALSRPVELFAQVNAIAPSIFPSYNEYVVRYCNARQTYWGFDVTGSSHLDELHTILTGTILIRRKKDDVLTQLPEKVRQVTWVETKASVMKLVARKQVEFEDAKAATSDASTPEEATALSMRVKGIQNELYALSAEAKLDSILEFCKDTAESGCKFIVFAHHTKVIDALDIYVSTKLKLGHIRIDGGTPQGDRQALCKKFQSDSNQCRVALLSITAAGVGLTLTKATVVLFAELYWNPGSLLQAEDRAHRIGQRNSILVTYLLAKKTIDESMWKTIRRKLTVVGQSLTGTAAKMDAEEGKKTDIGSSSTAGASKDNSKPFFPVKKKRTDQIVDIDDDDAVVESQVNDEICALDNESSSQQRVTKAKRKHADMFPDVVDLETETDQGAGNEDLIDSDLALARKLQQQYNDEELQ